MVMRSVPRESRGVPPRHARPARGAVCALAIFALCAVASLERHSAAVIRYVSAAACPGPGAGTQGDPYCKTQDAICASAAGDTISVAPGTYPESLRMRPGVAVVSEMGALSTTINGTNQPCTETDFCTKRSGNQCSVILFSTGHGITSVLDGFTITGGKGTVQSSWVAGGGVFVASTATIRNNIITNNVLSGPLPQGEDLRGAGIYISRGEAVITNNTISSNKAIPPAGGSGVTYGYGGGLWLGFLSAAKVEKNLITGNRAGDPNLASSLGSGGGVVVWTPGGTTSPVVNSNLIQANSADSQGGGISLLSLNGTAAEALVTNNVLVGNTANFGGGVYTYFNRASIVNNTITKNSAFLGGGIYSGQSDVTLPVMITNNAVVGNLLTDGIAGTGGGIYTLDLSATFNPTISHNDLWNNQKNNCAGDRTDGTCIGVSGNFSANPLFVDPNGGDYHLDANSPAIDRASQPPAPPLDADGNPRGVDGDGAPNSPMPGDVDVGAFEFAACLAGTEVCDGMDNDCDLLVDEGFADTDLDGLADCVDPDDDNDLVPDGSDCAPLDATAFGVPQAVTGVGVTGAAPATIQFTEQSIGSGTTYEVISGLASRLRATGGLTEGFCLDAAIGGSPWQDLRPAPPVGDSWYYLLRAANACGIGTFGSAGRDAPGAGDVCETGIVDLDFDGSPSHLDCNDNDPGLSPINPEICDGADNDCDLVADNGNPGGGLSCGASNIGECAFGATECVAGTIVCHGAVDPAPELCDGLDNDCDGTPDNDVVDSDMDGQDDCADSDDDNDLVADGSDCAPLDPTAHTTPSEIQDLEILEGLPTPLSWTVQTLGSGTQYDVATGLLETSGNVDFPSGTCLAVASASPANDARPAPAPGSVFYYLVRSRNACGTSTYGSAPRDLHPGCP